MKRLVNLVILVSLVGVFFSGFVFWMANSSHQEAERLRQQGVYIHPGNAASVAQNMLMTCVGFAVLVITGLTVKVLCRTRRFTRTTAGNSGTTEEPPSVN
jgi:hypothetical protein